MRTFVHGAATWDVEGPRRPSRMAGVTMAGFRIRGPEALRIVPHPAVTLLLDFGDGWPVLDCGPGGRSGGASSPGRD